ncbi:uncharacterized protein ACNLHF_018123 [Anomaloglossus baeobatrachus]
MFRGRKSNEKAIHVYDPLPQPMITLEQPNMPEIPIDVKCSTPRHHEWKHIRFFINGTEIFMATSSSKMAINEIKISVQKTAGLYSCNYQTQKLGRLIDSEPSENVDVNILDFTTKRPTTIPKTSTNETDRDVLTSTSASYTSGEFSNSNSVSVMITEIDISEDLLTWVYYVVGSLLCALLVVLLTIFICRFYLPIKWKRNRPVKTPFWMNYSTRKKSRKTSPTFQMPMIAHEKDEKSVYNQPDQFTTFMNPSSSLKPSNNQGSVVHCADVGLNIYDSIQETAPITSVHITLESQKHL